MRPGMLARRVPMLQNPGMTPWSRSLFVAMLAVGMLVGAPKADAQAAAAQSTWEKDEGEFVYAPRTGNAWTDRHLSDINAYAARYPQSFLDEIARYYGVSRAYAESLIKAPAWEAGDVLMACALAKTLEKPCREVVREWSRDHADGWAGVAKRMQGKPDAKQNRAIREQIEASYTRWARPLVD